MHSFYGTNVIWWPLQEVKNVRCVVIGLVLSTKHRIAKCDGHIETTIILPVTHWQRKQWLIHFNIRFCSFEWSHCFRGIEKGWLWFMVFVGSPNSMAMYSFKEVIKYLKPHVHKLHFIGLLQLLNVFNENSSENGSMIACYMLWLTLNEKKCSDAIDIKHPFIVDSTGQNGLSSVSRFIHLQHTYISAENCRECFN